MTRFLTLAELARLESEAEDITEELQAKENRSLDLMAETIMVYYLESSNE